MIILRTAFSLAPFAAVAALTALLFLARSDRRSRS